MIKEYKKLLSEIGTVLSAYGFTKKGDTFFSAKNENWALIDFQKSRSSSPDKIVFTITIGICSVALRRFANEDLSVNPKIEDCHWKKRIGMLLPINNDFWFQIDN